MNTVIADDRGRVKVAEPGERFDLSRDAEGRIILRKLQPKSAAPLDNLPEVKLGRGGKLIWPKGVKKPSSADIARSVRQERDRR